MTMKKKFGICSLLVAMLLMSIVFVSAVSAQEEVIDQKLTFSPSTFEDLKKSPDIFTTFGKMPFFENLEQRKEWLNLLHNVSDNVRDNPNYNISEYMHPKGPVVGYGYDINGSLIVIVETGKTLKEPEIENIYNLFKMEGLKKGITDVPIVFEYGGVPKLDSRTSSWSPLIGGIQIETELPEGIADSTIGFAAQTSSGTKGYVVSGHAAPSIGDQIWQPTAGPTANKVGTVSKVGGYNADASWVPNSNVVARIYDTDTDVRKDVKSYANNPQVGSTVYKSGISTGKTSGTVLHYLSSTSHPTFGTLSDQYTASYSSAAGDSGSPIYCTVTGGVQIVGIHWGAAGSTRYFSPIAGVYHDLSVNPLIM